MKNQLFCLLLILVSFTATADTIVSLNIDKSVQDGKYIYNAATSKVTSSPVPTNITNGIGWTTKCPDSFDAHASKQIFVTLKNESVLSYTWLNEPTGWRNKWACNKTYACSVAFKALGLATLEVAGTIMGSGGGISLEGAVSEAGSVTTYMTKKCSDFPCINET